MRYFLFLIGLFQLFFAQAQENANNLTNLSGQIHDQISKKDLENATVELLNFIPRKLAQTNLLGEFELNQIPLGRHKLLIKKEGYENKVVSNIIISSGNKLHLEIDLQQSKAEISPSTNPSTEAESNYFKSDKDQANNPHSSINAEPFTMEEVSRYAGARMDLSRLTNNLAGISNNYDARNDIVVRGISPAFTSWQIEEMPVDNPNHFGFMGASGGTNSMINIFALGKADFIKGGAAAQYGNAISGVFDLSLRKGNSKNLQLMGVLGTQRGELLLESPLSKKLRNSSILLSFRHSTGSYLFQKISETIKNNPNLALTIRDWADPQQTDLNLKIDLGKLGRHSVEAFLIGGFMEFFLPHNNRSVRDEIRFIAFENESFSAKGGTAIVGLKHSYRPNHQLLFRNIIGGSYQYQYLNYLFHQLNPVSQQPVDFFTTYIQKAHKINYTWHSYLQAKTKKTLSKIGLIANVYNVKATGNYILFNYYDVLFDSIFTHSQAYAQTRWDISEKLNLSAGVNVLHSSLAAQLTVSPNLGLHYNINPQHNLSLSAGIYHQTQHLQSLIAVPYLGFDSLDNNIYDFNERFARMLSSRQLNFEYNWLISKNWRLKLQAYYYQINNARISKDSSYYSGLNTSYSFFDTNYAPTVANGQGENKGVELSIQKFFQKGWYLLANASVYDAQVQSSDGVWRKAIFNNRFVANFLIGREFVFGTNRQNVFFSDIRFSTHGGRPYTPIDVEATYQNGLQNLGTEAVLIDSLYNSSFTPNFYQIDVKLGFRFNSLKTKATHTLRIDLFNAFNFNNVYDYRYSANYDLSGNPVRGTVVPIYQRGFLPDLTYLLQF